MSNSALILAQKPETLSMSTAQAELLAAYMQKVLVMNEQINLTSIREPADFIKKHILDSLAILSEFDEKAKTILDLGTGGGFPGIPLAIMRPQTHIVLMDATVKKLKVVKQMADELGLTNVTILQGRAEELGKQAQYREQFEVVVSRAVAHFAILAELAIPLVKEGGFFFAMKGRNYQDEMSNANKICKNLGGKIVAYEPYMIDDTKNMIIKIKKEARTPAQYPRAYGRIKKETQAK